MKLLDTLLENSLRCHSEEPKATRNLSFALILCGGIPPPPHRARNDSVKPFFQQTVRGVLPGRALAALVTAVFFGWLAAPPARTGVPAHPAQGNDPHAGQSKEKSKRPESTTLRAAQLIEEKGKLRILLDGQQVGSEEFQISAEGSEAAKQWTARGATEIRLPEGTARISGRLKLASDGMPLRYEWSAQGQKKASATVEFQGGTAKMALQLEGAQPFLQELSFGSRGEPGRATPRVVILDNNLYHHYALLARLYDWSARGPQTFPVLIPQEMTPGSIVVESLGAHEIDGARLELLRVRSPDLEIHLYLDSTRRLVRLAVPASKALILRE